MNTIPKIEEKLTRIFPLQSDAIVDSQHFGMRTIIFEGNILRHLFNAEDSDELLNFVKEQLPKDAVIMNIDGPSIRLLPQESLQGFKDSYALVIASSEWPEIIEGGIIPNLNIFESREDVK